MSLPVLLPVPEGHTITYTHLHDLFDLMVWANDEELDGDRTRWRQWPRYVTIARLYKDDVPVASGQAICSHRDNPSRKLGRIIAHNRCLKSLKTVIRN